MEVPMCPRVESVLLFPYFFGFLLFLPIVSSFFLGSKISTFSCFFDLSCDFPPKYPGILYFTIYSARADWCLSVIVYFTLVVHTRSGRHLFNPIFNCRRSHVGQTPVYKCVLYYCSSHIGWTPWYLCSVWRTRLVSRRSTTFMPRWRTIATQPRSRSFSSELRVRVFKKL